MAGALSDPARAHVVRISRREEVSARHPRGGGTRRRRERCSNARPTVEPSTGVSPLARDTPRAALGVVGFAPLHNAFKNFFVVSCVSWDAPNRRRAGATRTPPRERIDPTRADRARTERDAREKATSAGSPYDTRHNDARATACSSSHYPSTHASRALDIMALARFPSDTFFRDAFREADDVRGVPRRRDTTTASRTLPATTRSLAPPFPPRSSSPTSSRPRAGSWSL